MFIIIFSKSLVMHFINYINNNSYKLLTHDSDNIKYKITSNIKNYFIFNIYSKLFITYIILIIIFIIDILLVSKLNK